MSDRHLTASSGLLRHLKYGDLVLADRGFDIVDDLAIVGASLAIPPFLLGETPAVSAGGQVFKTAIKCENSCKESHWKDQTYKILNSTLPIRLIKQDRETKITTIDKIVFVCAALSN